MSAQAVTQFYPVFWIPAYAGMTWSRIGKSYSGTLPDIFGPTSNYTLTTKTHLELNCKNRYSVRTFQS